MMMIELVSMQTSLVWKLLLLYVASGTRVFQSPALVIKKTCNQSLFLLCWKQQETNRRRNQQGKNVRIIQHLC